MRLILLAILLSALVNGVNSSGLSVIEVNEKNNVHHLLYQGDIVLSREHAEQVASGTKDAGGNNVHRLKRQAMNWKAWPQMLWIEGLNYVFDDSISDQTKNAFRDAAKQWESQTCINFTENPSAKHRVKVTESSGCWSSVGKLSGEQELSLGDGCALGFIAAHEIGHSLGFIHTHSRVDRDNFVKVNYDVMQAGQSGDFMKYTQEQNDNFGLAYDYGSIMHYAAADYSTDGSPVLVPHDYYYIMTMGSPFISFNDYYQMNILYGCNERCNSQTSARCENGGFPHPRNCSKCVCPSGYGGDLCNERPSGCGQTLQASSNWTTLSDMLDFQGGGDYTQCYYWIESPSGTTIEVKLADFPYGYVGTGCNVAGFELKVNKNQTLTGYRFCTPDGIGHVFQSYSNRVPVITYSSVLYSFITTDLEYRYDTSYLSQIEINANKHDNLVPARPAA